MEITLIKKLLDYANKPALQDIRWGAVGYVALITTIINLMMLFIPIYILQIFDRVIIARSVDTLLAMAVGMSVILLIVGTLETYRAYLQVRISNHMDIELGKKLMSAMSSLAIQTSKVSTQPLSDLNQIRMFVTSTRGGIVSFFDAPWIPVFLIIVYIIHPMLGFVMLGFMATFFILTYLSELSVAPASIAANEANSIATAKAMDTLKNAQVVNAMGMHGTMQRIWQKYKFQSIGINSDASEKNAKYDAMATTLQQAQMVVIFSVGAYLVIMNDLSIGGMIAANILSSRGSQPFQSLISGWKSFGHSSIALDRLNELLSIYYSESKGMQLPEPKGKVALENVYYRPGGSKVAIIQGVSLNFDAGDFVGIIGPNGSGKSTLAKLIVGVYQPVSGHVRLDDAELSDWDREILGQYIGYLPQDVLLFDGSIKDNISRFLDVEDKLVIEAAQLAGVHKMILNLSDGYETKIGQGGIQLSGGQMQRIALARAFFGTPKLLVLDEPNASLDSAGEKALFGALKRAKESGITIVAITHKPNLLFNADKICTMMQGKITSVKSPSEVLENFKNKTPLLQNKANGQEK